MHFVYILLSKKDQSHYYGLTRDLRSRLSSHNAGQVAYTAKHRPWKLIWFGAFISEQKAFAFEKYLKTGSGHAFSRKRLIGH
jgi:putative endonuclease